MASPHELKQLQVRRAALQAKLNRLGVEFKTIEEEYDNVLAHLKEIESKIRIIKTEPTVSEHALLRYLERVYNLSMEEIKEAIMPKDIIPVVKKLGSGKIPVGDSHKLIVKNMVVVSVVCDDE
jgi:hypothetical protein